MGNKKTNFPSILPDSKSLWSWPYRTSCKQQPRTLSFRCAATTVDGGACEYPPGTAAPIDSAPESDAESNRSEGGGGDAVEEVIQGLKSRRGRLFFDPGGETRSIREERKDAPNEKAEAIGSAEVLAMDSADPYSDFRSSMEEMAEAHGLRDWEGLEELLGWYLRENSKDNHGYIFGAFVDLLVGIAFASCSPLSSSSSSNNSSVSSFSPLTLSSCSLTTTPCLSFLETEGDKQEEEEEEEDRGSCVNV